MRPEDVRQSWAVMAGAEVLANLLDRRGIKQALWEIDEDTLNELRETIGRLALAAVLPLAVAEERAECARVLEERIKEIQHNIDDNIAEVRVAEVTPADNRPLIKARDWLRDVLAAIRSRGEPR